MENKKYKELHSLFQKAESYIKKLENIDDRLPIPPVNELRYAGFHCLSAIAAENEREESDEIKTAEKHCKRAIYDALEVGIVFYMRETEQFKTDYRLVNINAYVDGFSEDMRFVRDLKDYVAEHSREQAESEWETMENHFGEIRRIHDKLEVSREPIKAALFKWRLGLIVALFGIFIALMGILL